MQRKDRQQWCYSCATFASIGTNRFKLVLNFGLCAPLLVGLHVSVYYSAELSGWISLQAEQSEPIRVRDWFFHDSTPRVL